MSHLNDSPRCRENIPASKKKIEINYFSKCKYNSTLPFGTSQLTDPARYREILTASKHVKKLINSMIFINM